MINADRATFADLQACLPSNGNIHFIRGDHFTSFHKNNLKQLHDFRYERAGPEHEFLDVELEECRKKLRSRMFEFLALIGTYTFRERSDINWQEIPKDWEDFKPELFGRVLKELGDAATLVLESYDELVRLARRKLA